MNEKNKNEKKKQKKQQQTNKYYMDVLLVCLPWGKRTSHSIRHYYDKTTKWLK